MIPGFVKIDKHVFYGEVWPKISNQVDAVQSNLPKIKLREESVLIVLWGYKHPETGENVILATSSSSADTGDEHWVIPSLAS